ncbi:MAG: hypothetical protein WAW37_01545, partial [Syntrophobacteraceae bacterium]
SSPAEKTACVIVPQVINPNTEKPPVPADSAEQAQRIGSSLDERTQKLGWITKTLPLAFTAVGLRLHGRPAKVPEFSKDFIASVSTGIGVSVPGIDIKEIDASEAGIGTVGRISIVLVE